ncbi:GDSL esterase/lipase At5g03610-like [Corylus avellana]|uniref:GDSL esterase/lipase At5g03610-like n=1 Tax=Corylus avellana TaxID=13451 RepID=UPI00286B0750|nr:GDSL esterase/lipase At5g03610-like [Corylus avellana]
MDTQKLLYCVLCYFLLSLLSAQQVVRGSLAPHHHHHHHSHRHISKFRPSKLFVFGDSYADTGNTGKAWPSWKYPYGITFPGKPAGRFSDGRVLTDYIAKFVGVRSPIPYRWRKYGIPLLKYGMNFAYGGTGVFQTLYPGPNMTTQIDTFHPLITDNVFTIRDLQSSVALVTLSGNDYAYIASSGGSAPAIQSFILKVVKQLAVNLKRIHGLGVKKVAVTALQPLGCLPRSTAMASFRQCNGTVNLLVNYHNLLLEKAVATLNNETNDSPFLILDLYASFMFVIENKGSRKFENPLKPCCFGISSDYNCGNVDESGAKKYTLCKDPKASFFWDGAHPTQEGWNAVYSALQPTLEHLY